MTEKAPSMDLVLRDEFALLSCADMAKADAAAIAGGAYGTELMEAAGRAVVVVALPPAPTVGGRSRRG